MMVSILRKTLLFAVVATLMMAAVPAGAVHAQEGEPPQKPAPNERLERVWARQLERYERLIQANERMDDRIAKIQERIDKAAADGKDVAALQAALDAFEAAIQQSRPIYESMAGLVNAHAGFDGNGKVIDSDQAQSTVQEMREKMQALKTAMGGTGKALKEAIKAFREANKPAEEPARRD